MTPQEAGSAGKPLAGRCVLVVEDEFLLADEMCALIERFGGEVMGPASTTDAALGLLSARAPDLALLDVNLSGNRVYPVADALREGGIPFAFTTGYDRRLIDARFRNVPHLEKPFSAPALLTVLDALTPAH